MRMATNVTEAMISAPGAFIPSSKPASAAGITPVSRVQHMAAIGIATVHLLQHIIADDLVLPLWIAFATLPFYTLMQMQDGIARAHNWVNVALLPTYVVRHLIMLVLVSAAYLLGLPADAEVAVIAVAAALLLTVTGQTIVLNRKLVREIAPGPKSYERKTWLSVSLPILMVEGFYLLLTNTDIVMRFEVSRSQP